MGSMENPFTMIRSRLSLKNSKRPVLCQSKRGGQSVSLLINSRFHSCSKNQMADMGTTVQIWPPSSIVCTLSMRCELLPLQTLHKGITLLCVIRRHVILVGSIKAKSSNISALVPYRAKMASDLKLVRVLPFVLLTCWMKQLIEWKHH